MNNPFILLIGLIFFGEILFAIVLNSSKDHKKPENDFNKNRYYKKKFLTPAEQVFFQKLKELENEFNVKVVPQVNLATIVKKEQKYNHQYQTDLFRNIDFGIFDNKYENILLLVELNDSSHNQYNRKQRDQKVKYICKSAGINLITFYTNKPNEKVYIRNKIQKELEKIRNGQNEK